MNARQWSAFWLLSLIWGSSFLLIKIGLEAMGPLTLVALRVACGALVLWVVVRWRRLPIPTAGTTIGALVLMGLFNNALPFSLITWGETTIDSGLAAVLNSTVPLFTIVIAHLGLQDERITLQKIVGLLIGFLGVVIVVRSGATRLSLAALRSGELGGQIAVILASASYAAAAVFVRRYLRGVHPFVLAAAQLTASVFFMWTAVFLREWPLAVGASSASPLLAVLMLGVVNTGIAYMFYFFLIREVGATRTTLVTYVIPAIGLALGFIFLDESLRPAVILGFLLVIAGVILVNRRSRQASKPTQSVSLSSQSAGD